MKVKLLQNMVGIAYGHNKGDVIDCNAEEAQRFIDTGVAEAVRQPTQSKKPPKVESGAK